MLFTIALSCQPSVAADDTRPDPLATWRLSRGQATTNNLTNAQHHERDTLIWDLLNVAISNALWLDNTADPSTSLQPFHTYVDGRDREPGEYTTWVTPFAARPDGLPRHGGIVKWTNPVTVGIGWPNQTPTPDQQLDPALLELVPTHIQAVSSPVKRTTPKETVPLMKASAET